MQAPHLLLAVVVSWLLLPTAAVIAADTTLAGLDNQLTLAIEYDHHDDALPPRCPGESGHGTQHGDACATNSISLERFETLGRLRSALQIMQTSWFEVWVGNWPSAIDWTRAVVDTHLIATLRTVSSALDESRHAEPAPTPFDEHEIENEINTYFTQNVAYYFGENAFRIRNEAYDDMLWVVLGWLESVKFIYKHSEIHRAPSNLAARWHGSQFIEAFAHRARIFYDVAARGWDTRLCGGGMVWSPVLAPYKNAITNELFISASVGMYLYFPGDNNSSPFTAEDQPMASAARPYERFYLQNAIDAYDWLNKSGMTNDRGLYTDGFHISHWKEEGTKCDARNEMVYTYNQGVVLSGLRGLWEGTANRQYLEDGHELVDNVMHATGWPEDALENDRHDWAGLGRDGILEDHCDAAGRCSQDAQTFKSIFFHHLALFCETLPLRPATPGKTHAADKELAYLHRQSCKRYVPWVEHNAKAALKTRNEHGQFGMWWGAREDAMVEARLPSAALDYRNNASVVLEPGWSPKGGLAWGHIVRQRQGMESTLGSGIAGAAPETSAKERQSSSSSKRDLNDRGRGRTVETHAGGLAVLRCLWELSNI